MALDRAQFLVPPSQNPLGSIGAVKAGTGITIGQDGTISTAGGGEGIKSLTAGLGISLSPNPITDTGTITNSGVRSLTGSGAITVSPTTGDSVIRLIASAVTVFDPIQGLTQSAYTGRTGSGSIGNVGWTCPNGANYAVLWSRVRMLVYSQTTGAEANQVAWAGTPTYQLSAGGGASLSTNGTGQMPMICVPSRDGRGNGTCFTRFDLIRCPGSGNRSYSISATGSINSGPAGTSWYGTVGELQVIILPFEL